MRMLSFHLRTPCALCYSVCVMVSLLLPVLARAHQAMAPQMMAHLTVARLAMTPQAMTHLIVAGQAMTPQATIHQAATHRATTRQASTFLELKPLTMSPVKAYQKLSEHHESAVVDWHARARSRVPAAAA
jgi:hypothetical protein